MEIRAAVTLVEITLKEESMDISPHHPKNHSSKKTTLRRTLRRTLNAVYVSCLFWTATWTQSAPHECTFDGTPPALSSIDVKDYITGLTRPIKAQQNPQFPGQWFIAEQDGKIKLMTDRGQLTGVALDLTGVVTDPDDNVEGGLLGLAFHPQDPFRVFTNYTYGTPLKSRIAEWHMNATGVIEEGSEKVILEIDQPFSNHNGGEVAFGPDGYLYLGLGDGGSAGDPKGNAQNLQVLLGKILRIDVDHGKPYSIPLDNPFVHVPNARPEIFAYGLRNPWRFSWDSVTKEMWAGDVGQDRYEEVDIIKSGGNYGWRTMEGASCYKPSTNCKQEGLEKPVFSYPRADGVSITGGYVYRGQRVPQLAGTYVFADFQTGAIFGLRNYGKDVKKLAITGRYIPSLAQDAKGELYALDYLKGQMLSLTLVPKMDPNFPNRLSESGCFTSLKPLVPSEKLTPFEVNSPLWSDGVKKDRFILTEKVIGYDDAPWEFAEHTTMIKNFWVPSWSTTQKEELKIVETRILTYMEGVVKGYTYLWNNEQTDAVISGGATQSDYLIAKSDHDASQGNELFSYYFPSSKDCERCHNDAKGPFLGFSLAQLNRPLGPSANQLDLIKSKSWFDSSNMSTPAQNLLSYADYRDDKRPTEARMRSMLEVQCSTCHNGQTPTQNAKLNLNFQTPWETTGLIGRQQNTGIDFGLSPAYLVTPGNPEASVLYKRIASRNLEVHMPPIATRRQDDDAVLLVKSWITDLKP
jgi:glucose/arabinose dehydrogenase